MVSSWIRCCGMILFLNYTCLQAQSVSSQLDLVDILIDQDSLEKARRVLDEISADVQNSDNLSERIFFHKLEGDYFLSTNEYEQAVVAYSPLLDLPTSDLIQLDNKRLARGINDLGIALMKIGNHNRAKQMHQISIELYDRFNDHQGASFNYNNLALIYQEAKEIDSALTAYELSLHHAKLAGDTLGIGYNHLNLAILFSDNKQPIESFRHFQDALFIFEQQDNQGLIHVTKRNLAKYYNRIGDHKSCLEMCKDLRTYYENHPSKNGIAATHEAMAEAYIALEAYEEAEKQLKKSLEYYIPTGYKKGISMIYTLYGRLYRELHMPDSALIYYKKSLEYATNLKGMYMINLTGIAHVYLEYGDYQKAIRFAKESLESIDFSESVNNLAARYNILYQSYKALGNEKQALHYLEKINEVRSKQYGEDKALEIARIEYKNQLNREREIRETEAKNQAVINAREKQKQQFILWSLVGLVLMVVVIAVFIYRAGVLKNRTNKFLKERNDALTALRVNEQKLSQEIIASKDRALAAATMAQHEKNNILGLLDDKIAGLNAETFQRNVKDVRKMINESYSLDKSWDSFVHRFEDVHPGFFDELRSKSTQLTMNDLKLSAYIKIGMSNKEIANVTHLTLGSVKSKINRLKKKLEMSGTDDIRTFLMEI